MVGCRPGPIRGVGISASPSLPLSLSRNWGARRLEEHPEGTGRGLKSKEGGFDRGGKEARKGGGKGGEMVMAGSRRTISEEKVYT